MMTLTFLSPERKIAENVRVSSVLLTGSEGQIEILPGHAEMIGTLETGIFAYTPEGGTVIRGAISTGFFEVKGDHVKVMAETSEAAGEIDLARAKSAQKKAEAALSDPHLDQKLFRKYELKLQRALIRQQVAGLGMHGETSH